MTTLLGRFIFAPTKQCGRHDIARGNRALSRFTTFFAQIDRRLIVRSLSVFAEVMTRYARPPFFNWLEVEAFSSRLFDFNSLTRHLLRVWHQGRLYEAPILYYLRFQGASPDRSNHQTATASSGRANPNVIIPGYFHSLRLKTNPTPKAMTTVLVGFC
jgi:hypothetical protein